jgi:hypothetical protein
MSIQQQILDAVVTLIDAQGYYAALVYGPLPAENGLCIAPSTGSVSESTLAHGGSYSMQCVLNGKHSEQGAVRDTLFSIHEYLNKLSIYPSGTGWAVTGIRTNGAPGYVDRDETQWLYGSSIEIDYSID